MKTKCHRSKLANRIMRWFDESQAEGKTFDCWFTRKDSRAFLHNFMMLIAAVQLSARPGTKVHYTQHVLAYTCLTLRNCVSLFSRVEISDEQLADLEKHCRTYFLLHCLFFTHHPSSWTLGNVVPVHTKQMKEKYGLGPSLNSMEGREAEHISISRYCRNTNYKSRWEQVFLHAYVFRPTP